MFLTIFFISYFLATNLFINIYLDYVTSVAFSDKYLATGSWDKTVNLIDIQSKIIYYKFDNYILKFIAFIFINFILNSLLYHQYIDNVNTVAFSPNGK